jgi:hypothetical protein
MSRILKRHNGVAQQLANLFEAVMADASLNRLQGKHAIIWDEVLKHTQRGNDLLSQISVASQESQLASNARVLLAQSNRAKSDLVGALGVNLPRQRVAGFANRSVAHVKKSRGQARGGVLPGIVGNLQMRPGVSRKVISFEEGVR